MIDSHLLHQPLDVLLQKYPYLNDFFNALSLSTTSKSSSLNKFILSLPDSQLSPFGLDHHTLSCQVLDFINKMEDLQQRDNTTIQQVTIQAGFDKTGNMEPMDVTLFAGEVVSVVGPTGSGKSRLLEDIECLAQGDTPSGRRILLDGIPPDAKRRFSGEFQMVAQLSQNMNFVMDLTVEEFLRMHAESRLVEEIPEKITRIFDSAVALAGEPFTLDTAVTALSGGQSRALMIADVAHLSASPIVLIDEIENAGVDRLQAVALLVNKEKIVVMATHDPLLALSGHRRIVIKNGGIVTVRETSENERKGMRSLVELDKKMARLREKVRNGTPIVFDDPFFQVGNTRALS